MKVIAVVLVQDKYFDSMGGRKCFNSFKYFHSEIKIIRFGSEKILDLIWKYPGFMWGSMASIVMKEVKDKYKTDCVILLDADSLVLGRMDEVFSFDYDVAASRNDPEEHTENESINRAYDNKKLPNYLFVNAGFIVCKSQVFIEKWVEFQKYEVQSYQRNPYLFYQEQEFPMREQDTFNLFFHSGKFKSKILDSLGSNLIYGSSSNKDCSIKDTSDRKSHVKNWKDIEYKNGQFFLDNKIVKRLHYGGGFCKRKMGYELFSDDIANKIKEITKCYF